MDKTTKIVISAAVAVLCSIVVAFYLLVSFLESTQEKRVQKQETNPYYALVLKDKTVGLVNNVCVNVYYVSTKSNIRVTPLPKELCQE
jgi:hypothetical protein